MRVACAAVALCLYALPAAGAGLSGTAQAGPQPVYQAVVWLDLPGGAASAPPKRAVLDQRNLSFEPGVLAVQVGAAVDFPNNDRVFHNVFSFHDGKKFDLGMYPSGTSKPIVFDKPGLSRIFCNIHPHMAAYVMAVESPYFAVSDRLGAFSIPDVPPGSYTFHAWRPGGSILTGSVAVDSTHPLLVRWP